MGINVELSALLLVLGIWLGGCGSTATHGNDASTSDLDASSRTDAGGSNPDANSSMDSGSNADAGLGVTCTASVTINFNNGETIHMAPCATSSMAAELSFTPDMPPSIRSLTAYYSSSSAGSSFQCDITIEQAGICGPGFYIVGPSNKLIFRTSGCSGISNDANRNSFTASNGWIHLVAANAGSSSGDFSNQPIQANFVGVLSVTTTQGHKLRGEFRVSQQITSSNHPGISCAPSADVDGDGYVAAAYLGTDCDDRNADVHPGAPETCNNMDDDCDGLTDNLWQSVSVGAGGSSMGRSGCVIGLQNDGKIGVNAYCNSIGTGFYGEVFRQISAGGNYAGNPGFCGVTTSGSIACYAYQNAPVLPGATNRVSASGSALLGNMVACGIDSSHAIVCASGFPTPPQGAFVEVAVGSGHACAISTSGTIQCWGANDVGQAQPPSSGVFLHVSAGYKQTCAIRSDGTVVCWGGGPADDHGVGGCGAQSSPNGTFLQISAGLVEACGVKSDSSMTCWRCGNIRQPLVGNGFSLVSTNGHLLDPATQETGGCAVLQNHSISCWNATAPACR